MMMYYTCHHSNIVIIYYHGDVLYVCCHGNILCDTMMIKLCYCYSKTDVVTFCVIQIRFNWWQLAIKPFLSSLVKVCVLDIA